MGRRGFATIKIPGFRRKRNSFKPYDKNVGDKGAKRQRKGMLSGVAAFVRKINIPVVPYIKNNRMILFFLGCMVLGIIIGALFFNAQDETLNGNLSYLFNSNYEARVSQSQLNTFASSITSSFAFVLATMLMGMSVWGLFLVPLVPFFKGFGIGISSSFLFYTYSFKGMLFSIVVILPGLLISTIALLIASREATYFSLALFKTQIKNNRTPLVKAYLLQNLKVFVLIVLSALVDVFFSWCFCGVFVFQ